LASAVLMPQAPFRYTADQVIRQYGRRYLPNQISREYIESIDQIANRFQVSKTAAKIRLMQFGYIREESPGYTRHFAP